MSPILIPVSGTLMFFTGLSAISFSFAAQDTSTSVTNEKSYSFYLLLGIGMLFNIFASFPILIHMTKRNIKIGIVVGSMATVLIFVSDLLAISLYNDAVNDKANIALHCISWIVTSVYFFMSLTFVVFLCLTLCNSRESRLVASPGSFF